MKTELPDVVRFGREICSDFAQASSREWWLANGLGGYAAGTVSQCLTRRYHGLLIAPTRPPLGRTLVFAKADATLHDGEKSYPLFSNRWGSGAVEPHGYINLESFRLDGCMPVWRFAIGDLIVEQCIWMEPGQHTTYIAWRLVHEIARPIYLTVDLLANDRDHHGTCRPCEFNPVIEGDESHISVRHHHGPTLHFQTRDGRLATEHQWIDDFDLSQERERGLPDRDRHLCVARMHMQAGSEWCGVVASLSDDASPYFSESIRRRYAYDLTQLTRADMLTPELCEAPGWIRQLLMAADSFLIARPVKGHAGESIIAGYPWFGDWGRDTMIALPGLALVTGRYSTAKNILTTFACYVDQGMLPNTFPDNGDQPQYNTVDAALWYFEAWRAYIAVSHDMAGLQEIYPLLEEMVDWHVRGTRYGIGLDINDGLLRAGEPGVQLTWMDAKIGDWVVTPRHGKPVEINALWYNALECMVEFGHLLGKQPKTYELLAQQARVGFVRFVKEEGGLYDVLDGVGGDDTSVRPNQIFAVSLPHSPLEPKKQAQVVDEVVRHLLTSYGLRSLTPEHPDYHPRYEGDVWKRDSAYHQGTVWAWLLPHFALAEHRVTGDAVLAQSRLMPIRDHLLNAGLGTVSEIFDGDPPHTARGAPSQAWSVACVLEAWVKLEHDRRNSAQGKSITQA